MKSHVPSTLGLSKRVIRHEVALGYLTVDTTTIGHWIDPSCPNCMLCAYLSQVLLEGIVQISWLTEGATSTLKRQRL